MKRYLLVGIAVLFVSANASLIEDFAHMDQEQEKLLSEMRKSAALSGDEDMDEDVNEGTDASEESVEPAKIVKEDKVVVDASRNVSILTTDNTDGKITTQTIATAFEKAGFFINDNRDMTAPWLKQCKAGTKNFTVVDYDVYNLFTIFKKDVVVKLGKKYPKIGLFSPMSMSIYTRKGTKTISVSSLSTAAMAEVMGIPADDADLVAYGQLVQDTLKAALPNANVETVKYEMKKPEGDLVTTAQFAMDPDGDWEEIKDQFQADFEAALIPAMFINAGFNDLNYEFEENGFETYNFYDVYSICYLEVIYTVSKTHPEAGAFAPCSMYMYQNKETNTMEIGFPSVYNWISSLAIEDKESHDILIMAQKKMEDILKALTAKNESDSAERADAIRQKAMAETKEKEEAQKALAKKAEALKAQIAAKEAEIKKVKELKKAEAERREVEAYEKQRAEKLAQEAAKKSLEEAAAKQKNMKKLSAEETKNTDIAILARSVGDVNISHEAEEKTKDAEAEYQKAMKEMQEED